MRRVLLKFCKVILILICLAPAILVLGNSKKVYAYEAITVDSDMIHTVDGADADTIAKMLDDDYTTKWKCTSVVGDIYPAGDGSYNEYYMEHWFVIDLGKPYIIREYDLRPSFSGNYCGATDFEFAGSNTQNPDGSNNSDWNTMDVVTDYASTWYEGYDTKFSTLSGASNDVAYQYYRVKITRTYGETSQMDSAEICDFYLYGDETFTVSFNSNEGSSIDSQTIATGGKATAPTAPTKAGNNFGGWYQDSELTDPWNFSTDTVTKDTTLYAKWIPTYEVTFESNGGNSVVSQTIETGGKVTKPADPTKANNHFGGWYSNSGLTDAWDFATSTVTATTTLYAKWIPIYEVTFESNGGNSVVSQTIETGGKVTEPADPTKANNHFGGWYSNSGLTNAWDFATSTVTATTTLYAKWIPIYEVTFESNGGSSVISQTIETGGKVTKPTDPTKTDNLFAGWYKESGLTNAWNFSTDTVTAATTLYAKWTPVTYTVTFNSNGGTGVTNQTIATGGKVTKPTDPTKADNLFAGWYKEIGLTNAWNFSTDTVTAATTLYAKWTPVTYTVTFNSNGGTGVTNQIIATGGKVTKPTDPTKADNLFAGWYKEIGLTNAWNFSTDTVTAATTLYAKWTPVTSTPTEPTTPTTPTTPAAEQPVTTTPTTVEKITVEVKQGAADETATQITVERTTDADGKKSDTVTFKEENAVESVAALKKAGNDTAKIIIPDAKNEVSETTVKILPASLDALATGKVGLQIEAEEAKINIPKESLKSVNDSVDEDIYFNLKPINESAQKQEVAERTLLEVGLISGSTGNNVSVVSVPMTIETNLPSANVDITLPLAGVTLPADPAEREAFLNKLAVFIEHSDGDKELVKGEIVQYKDGVLGIKFHVTKFSTFTIIKTDTVKKSSACKITMVSKPAKSTISGTKITATVANKTSSLTIKVAVSDKATWALYSDKACKQELSNHKVKLKVGINKVYIKVTAENGTKSKIYVLTIKREESSAK